MRANTHFGKHMIHRMKLTIGQSALTMHRLILSPSFLRAFLILRFPLRPLFFLFIRLVRSSLLSTVFCTIAPLDADTACDHVYRLVISFVKKKLISTEILYISKKISCCFKFVICDLCFLFAQKVQFK